MSLPFDADRMRERRERKGLTLASLAARCASIGRPVSPQYLGRLEIGAHKPSAPMFKTICDALEVNEDDLLAEDAA